MRLRVLLVPAIAGMFLLGACGDDSGSSSSSPSAAAPADAAAGGYTIPSDAAAAASSAAAAGSAATDAGTVVAKSVAYNPTEITVKVGDTVTFKNQDSFAHTFTANDGQFDSDNVDGGGSFQYVTTDAGTIEFHCKIHSNMKGTITVEAWRGLHHLAQHVPRKRVDEPHMARPLVLREPLRAPLEDVGFTHRVRDHVGDDRLPPLV